MSGGFHKYEDKSFLEYKPEKVFVGKSPLNGMTRLSGGHGKAFDGNSILLKMTKDVYIFIGNKIFSFRAFSNITEYASPVGNSDVPYPYAIDTDKNYYLLIENVVIGNGQTGCDPYDYYYENMRITKDLGRIPPRKLAIKKFQDIVEFYIGDDPYTLTYKFNPATDYERLIPKLGEKMCIIDTSGKKYELTKEMYVDLIKKFGSLMEFKLLEKIEKIQKRL